MAKPVLQTNLAREPLSRLREFLLSETSVLLTLNEEEIFKLEANQVGLLLKGKISQQGSENTKSAPAALFYNKGNNHLNIQAS